MTKQFELWKVYPVKIGTEYQRVTLNKQGPGFSCYSGIRSTGMNTK